MKKLHCWKKILVMGAVSVLAVAHSAAQERPRGRVPPSPGAPNVGDKVADFTLPDKEGTPRAFSEILATAADGGPGWVLLVFYRGYW